MGAARRNQDLPRLRLRRERAVSCLLALFLLCVGGGCAHKTVIRTVPEGASVYVDGQYAGDAPVVVERYAGTGGQLRVRAEHDAFLEAETVLERTGWFLWPAALAVTPFLALPTLFIPFAGPFICGGWAILTSPTLAGLFFLRRYPEDVTITLMPRIGIEDGGVRPTDDWTVPDDYVPNPLPLPGDDDDDEPPLPQSPDPKRRDDRPPNPSPLPSSPTSPTSPTSPVPETAALRY